MGQAQQKRRAVMIVEDEAELRSLTASLLEDEQLDTIECESAEAADRRAGGRHDRRRRSASRCHGRN
jgi:CheY-like chemotaxis protein